MSSIIHHCAKFALFSTLLDHFQVSVLVDCSYASWFVPYSHSLEGISYCFLWGQFLNVIYLSGYLSGDICQII